MIIEKEGLLLQSNHGIFYEFIPLEQYGRFDSAQQPLFERLTLKDVELNKDYALILTTNSGLWAYSIGDVVRFFYFKKSTHRILVSGRTNIYLSFWGTRNCF